MAIEYIQLEGYQKFGLVTADQEHGAAISSLVLNMQRKLINVPATYAFATESEAAGARMNTVTINFMSDPTEAASLWSMFYSAFITDSSELKWIGSQEDAVVSTTNPYWAATLIVTNLDAFGPAGELRQSSATFPVKAGTLVRTTS